MNKIYLSGPISGKPDFKEAFQAAEDLLKKHYSPLNVIVLNPAKLPQGLRYSDYMSIDMAMLQVCDTIALLAGWEESEGSTAEHAYARAINMSIIYLEEIVNEKI